jgi:formylglycine-generating enzyme required for sulfatase activity
MKFALIPPGRFRIGTPPQELDRCLASTSNLDRRLRLKAEAARDLEIVDPFYLGTTEVTVGQFRRFVLDVKLKTHAEQYGVGFGLVNGEWVQAPGFCWHDQGEFRPEDDMPVGNVTWDEATRFCRWLSRGGVECRLPYEAEWEYACRAGGEGPWCEGVEDTLGRFAWFVPNAEHRPHPAGRRQPNRFGLFDMHGNRPEWCGVAPPTSALRTPLPVDAKDDRPFRGGGFWQGADRLRSAARDWAHPGAMSVGGFRVLRVIPAK